MNDTVLETTQAIGTSDEDSLYDRDFLRWLEVQADLIRSRQLDRLDLVNLLEEIEDMGNNLRRELEHRLEVLLMHLLKCQFQPSHKSGSWLGTLNTQRSRIKSLLRFSPSLEPKIMEFADGSYPMARKNAADETGISRNHFPALNPYSKEQILDEEFVP